MYLPLGSGDSPEACGGWKKVAIKKTLGLS